jgi:hypothetical protein
MPCVFALPFTILSYQKHIQSSLLHIARRSISFWVLLKFVSLFQHPALISQLQFFIPETKMAWQAYHQDRDPEADKQFADTTMSQAPGITIFLQPIAPPAALGLAGFAASTWITSSYIANWWGNSESPTIFFPFVSNFLRSRGHDKRKTASPRFPCSLSSKVGIFGGLAQFIAGLFGYKARDSLVTVINTMWGAFWISIGILYAFVVCLPSFSPRSSPLGSEASLHSNSGRRRPGSSFSTHALS